MVFVGVVVETVSRLTVIHRKLKHPQLWSEAAIVKALIYKYSNQHRKEKYFQGLKKVRLKHDKCLKILRIPAYLLLSLRCETLSSIIVADVVCTG